MGRIAWHAHEHVIGSTDTALVQLVLYGDHECPHSRRGMGLVAELLERFGDGLLFAFRSFPLVRLHPHAWRAALAAEAADLQHCFWDMHLELFRHQRALDDASLLGYAVRLGLDPQRFVRDLGSDEVRARVARDRESGEQLGVHSTPTFFVDGTKYDGKVDGIIALVEEEVTRNSAPGPA